ncbi:MAG TPA: GNAT family N-acetyltransferase [Phycisphaerae bacterium]|nr:GNAT family N-acetyltransferase [Phycisphaerae bacterium]HOB74845.1 GNAT family N-acetyltransferase [Phycisphaerae bacterium]HOJ54322.1 GNAT family N-acetyltransferase [Phycisphaerae bacterium]HOL26793.1 GNAT family N-acetyltransferase [Phycisphaerae bacterium]HPP19954.1 GNAT family N-acetyltransferase [Phycisphaerae bacterium]
MAFKPALIGSSADAEDQQTTPSRHAPGGMAESAGDGCANGVDPASVQVEIVTRTEQLAALREPWERLYAESDASAYACLDWLLAVFESDGTDDGLRICLLSDRHGLFGIVPLALRRRSAFRAELRFAGGGWPLCNTAILSSRCEGFPVLVPTLKHLRQHFHDWQYARLNRVPAGSPLTLAANSTPPFSRRMTCREHGASVVILLPESWEVYEAEVTPARWKILNRRPSELRRRGEVRMARVGLAAGADEPALEVVMQDALTVARASWQASTPEGRAICDDQTRDLFIESSRRMARRGMLDLSVLYFNGQPVSFTWGMARHPNTSILKMGFDPIIHKLSPGLVHIAELLRDSIDRGMCELDFGHEFIEYKSRWSQRRRPLYEITYFRRGRVGRVLDRLAEQLGQ